MVRIWVALASVLILSIAEAVPAGKAVFVTASFVGKNRLFVEDLARDEVRVFENGEPRAIEFFAGKEVPIAYGLLFDRALLPGPFDEPRREGSQIPSYMSAGNVAFQILDKVLAAQIGWIAAYDNEMRIAMDYTADSGRIKDAIDALRAPDRITEDSFLYGALLNSIRKLSDRNEKRRVLILFIHVMDFETADKLKNLKNLLAISNVEFFVAGFAPNTRSTNSRGLPPLQSEASLRQLGEVTAGAAYFAYREGIEGLGSRIASQIRTLYTIGFESRSATDDPPALKIECTRPGTRIATHPVVPIMQ